MKISIWIVALAFISFFAASTSAHDLTKIERKIVQEPAYASKPKYCLLVFGPDAETHVWVVLDGDAIYVDRNGNGDLTEDGERVAAKKSDGANTVDGKRMIRWEFDSDVRSWDLSNGEPLQILKPNPHHNIVVVQLSPDGSTFLTVEELPGEYESSPPRATSLRDVKTQQVRPLPDKVSGLGTFAPDSQTIAITANDGDGYTTAVKLFDTATAQEKLSIPITDPFTRINMWYFSPDGRLLMGTTQTFPARNNWQSWESSLKLWDVASGQEVASFDLDEKKSGFMPAFSPDGRTLAATNWQGNEAKVFLFDLPGRKLLTTIRLGEKAILGAPDFSPDGK